jgi:hypothetical protein
MKVDLRRLGVARNARVHDVWAGDDVANRDVITASVPKHGVVLLLTTPSEAK